MKKLILISCLLAFGVTSSVMASSTSTTADKAEPNTSEPVKLSSFIQPTSVIELFTSQGCSSCPPANKFAAKLAEDDDKLVLTYGVTYWDYLGWKDTFGDVEFTERQREYGKALGTQNIYTPQLVLNGSAHSPRYSRKDVETMPLSKSKPQAEITVSGGNLVIRSAADMDAKLVIVSYMPGVQSVNVHRGENGGRTLKLANVVTDVMPAEWDGQLLKTDIKAENGQAYAALFHDPKSAKITTAAVYAP